MGTYKPLLMNMHTRQRGESMHTSRV